jgi:hypothetical protein
MTKSLDNTIDLAECLGNILTDILSCYPTDQLDLVRDRKRITQQSRTRGLAFFTIDLPALGKRFDASLSAERLDLNGLPHSGGFKKGSQIPRLFRGLWVRVFHDNGCLREDADSLAVYFLRTLFYVGKKIDVPGNPEGLPCAPRYVYSTIREFYDVEQSLPPPSQIWDGDHHEITRKDLGRIHDLGHHSAPDDLPLLPVLGGREGALLDSVQLYADRVASSYGTIPIPDLKPKHGPGTVSDWPDSKYKYDFAFWNPNLERLFPFDYFGVSSIEADMERSSPLRAPHSYEGHSRLFAVPKDQKGPRLIAAEPLCNQWIQQGVANWLRDKTPETILGNCINFFDQEPSRQGALKASLTGEDATIDLKSASDRLSCALVQRMFRSNLSILNAIRACRTRFLVNTLDSKCDGLIKLRKYATQGSALTFPLQSIVFSMICLGVGKYNSPRKSLRSIARRIRVFGDDIIVPKEWVDDIIWVLTQMHLRVNQTKTHRSGNFRESCGMDAFRGVDVTPPYLHSLKSKALNTRDLASTLAVTNNLFMKGFWHTSVWMERTVNGLNKFIPVPHTSRVPGLVSFSTKGTFHDYDSVLTDSSNRHRFLDFYLGSDVRSSVSPGVSLHHDRGGDSPRRKLVRWNAPLQRKEIRLPVLISKEKNRKRPFTGGSQPLLEFFSLRLRREISEEHSGNRVREARNRVLDLLYPVRASQHGWISGAKENSFGEEAAGSVTLVRNRWVPLGELEFLKGS